MLLICAYAVPSAAAAAVHVADDEITDDPTGHEFVLIAPTTYPPVGMPDRVLVHTNRVGRAGMHFSTMRPSLRAMGTWTDACA